MVVFLLSTAKKEVYLNSKRVLRHQSPIDKEQCGDDFVDLTNLNAKRPMQFLVNIFITENSFGNSICNILSIDICNTRTKSSTC